MPEIIVTSKVVSLFVEAQFVNGKPTCGSKSKGSCPFYRIHTRYAYDICSFTKSHLRRSEELVDDEGNGFLIPCKGCIIHKIPM